MGAGFTDEETIAGAAHVLLARGGTFDGLSERTTTLRFRIYRNIKIIKSLFNEVYYLIIRTLIF